MTLRTATVTRHIGAPAAEVWHLLADLHAWPGWGPFSTDPAPHLHRPGVAHPLRLGRRRLLVRVTSPDAPYWLRYRLTSDRHALDHHAEVTLSPTSDGGTDLHWRATLSDGLAGFRKRRVRSLERLARELSQDLAARAEAMVAEAA